VLTRFKLVLITSVPPSEAGALQLFIVARHKDRRDHYLPQSYLRGFIDPARVNEPRPIWQLDTRYQEWRMRSAKEIAHKP
jgi:hypothetical protein